MFDSPGKRDMDDKNKARLIDAERADSIDCDIRDMRDAFQDGVQRRQIAVERLRRPGPAAREGGVAAVAAGDG
ncbi:hypothetical protein [Paraburkholderia diazotrophica]|uniref:hypothetical protein n=1 Tax=Paraburkholderia diazotrophica TaxID=667676 RepID=UPI00316E473C